MTISVALCTYNAAAYLGEQLGSIAAQTRLPDELVVCDDGSSDETAAIVRRFAATAPLEVRLEINPRNLGSAANFGKAVSLCRGELIALADQDDVWLPGKLQRLLSVLADNPRAGFAFSDAVMVDHQRRALGYTLWEAIRLSHRDQLRMNRGEATAVLLHRNVVTGATLAFRSEFRELLLPVPSGWVHDGWFALMISAVAGCVAVAEPLIEYRQHPAQQIGAKKTSFYRQYRRNCEKERRDYEEVAANYAAAGARLSRFADRLRDPELLAIIAEKADHYRARARMRYDGAWRLPIILGELSRHHYGKCSTGWKSLAQDLLH
jgi:glycosyltransferase involved in cell wall biosynthesis